MKVRIEQLLDTKSQVKDLIRDFREAQPDSHHKTIILIKLNEVSFWLEDWYEEELVRQQEAQK